MSSTLKTTWVVDPQERKTRPQYRQRLLARFPRRIRGTTAREGFNGKRDDIVRGNKERKGWRVLKRSQRRWMRVRSGTYQTRELPDWTLAAYCTVLTSSYGAVMVVCHLQLYNQHANNNKQNWQKLALPSSHTALSRATLDPQTSGPTVHNTNNKHVNK